MATKKPPVMEIAPSIDTVVRNANIGIRGITPYLHNRMAEKARRELLFPNGRKNAAQRATTMKHDPVEEFRSSPYILGEGEPTLLGVMASSFKGAMMTAALDLPGIHGTQIGRLLWVEGYRIPFWGNAQLHMSVTRSADQKKTPDIRTRAISPEWATIITVSYVYPLITEKTIMNLLTTGGRSAGVGDWRAQKGKGTFGSFEMISIDELEALPVMKQDRAVQVAALENAEPYDPETAELLSWFTSTRKDRGR